MIASCASIAATRVDVAALPGRDEGVDDLAQPVVAERAQRGLLAALGQSRVDALVGALQRAVDRVGGRLERLGHLLAREAEHVAQDEDRALASGQELERRDEGELDALALLVARLGPGQRLREAQALVGVGLDPHRLDQRRRGALVGVGGRAVVDREHELRAPLDRLEADVGGDRVQPRAQRASPLEARDGAPGAQQRVLHGVLGVVDGAEHAIAVGVEEAAVGFDEPGEGVLVAPAGGVEQLALRHVAPHPLRRALGCQKAISPPSGVATTLRHPLGPSRGSSSTRAPSRPARSVTSSTRSTST